MTHGETHPEQPGPAAAGPAWCTPENCPHTPGQIRRWRRRLAEERGESSAYRAVAQQRGGEEGEILRALAEAERRHEQHWLNLLGRHAEPPPRRHFLTRPMAWLARLFGPVFVLALLQRAEQRSEYDIDRDATDQMAADERVHGEVVRSLATRGRAQMSGTFRAAIFGANDGLVSNLALVIGIGATGVGAATILATGLAGLLAGALSMAAGEYVSVRSQRELLEASRPDPEVNDILPLLDVNENELALVYRARGEDPDFAEAHAAATLAAIRQGIDATTGSFDVLRTYEEVGDGKKAAASSFAFFASGALIPVLPYLFGLSGLVAVVVAALLVGLSLLGTGAVVGLLSGASPLKRALRQLAIGYGAAAITYGVGLAFGAQVS
ncbi:VIT1/CCC1 transporter family protein [Buchananella hordeovulneris]|uniref:VIT1/CCC1 transporter family protein n=1 Tax=Buchananella hordeovulneris TaxID=52770 RepID=UPI000F60010C|nr:VIT1/CCC1 family protein [Buchananella hordeovulneris]RRD42557.1 rubrerythrin family protein [Buchananella hordeovulneris]